MYNEKVMSILKEMKNMGRIKYANGIGKEKSVYGDIIELYLKVNETGIIENASFKAFGSPYLIACASILIDLIKEKPVQNVFLLSEHDLLNALGEVETKRFYIFELVISCLVKAVKNYYSKQGKK